MSVKNQIYLELEGQSKTKINPTEKGFRVVLDGRDKPFYLEDALHNDAEIYDAEYDPYYIVTLPGRRYILRKSVHDNNSNSNYQNVEILETEENINRHLAPKPKKTFGTLPSFGASGGRRKTRKAIKRRRQTKRR